MSDVSQIVELASVACDERLSRDAVAAQMLPAAVAVARTLTDELVTNDLPCQFNLPPDQDGTPDFDSKGGYAEGHRRYSVQKVTFKRGRLGRRQRHDAHVLVREHDPLTWTAFWDPANPDRAWDAANPPLLGTVQGLKRHAWATVHLANAYELARVTRDALDIIGRVARSEQQQTRALHSGAADADLALGLLASRP